MLLPCTTPQFGLAISFLMMLNIRSWFIAVAAEDVASIPVASVVTPVSRSNNLSLCIAEVPVT